MTVTEIRREGPAARLSQRSSRDTPLTFGRSSAYEGGIAPKLRDQQPMQLPSLASAQSERMVPHRPLS